MAGHRLLFGERLTALPGRHWDRSFFGAAGPERFGPCGRKESFFQRQDEKSTLPVFLRTLDGCTKVTKFDLGERISDVTQRIAAVVGAPLVSFTWNGKLRTDSTLVTETGVTRHAQIHAHGRIRGGATYGELVCSFCKRGLLGLQALLLQVWADETRCSCGQYLCAQWLQREIQGAAAYGKESEGTIFW